MTIFGLHAGPHIIIIIGYLKVYGGIWGYMEVYGGIWKYTVVYEGICAYMEVYGYMGVRRAR